MIDYFFLFNFDHTPDIDDDELLKRYFEMQKKYHPDLSSNFEFNNIITDVNLGYQILKDDIKRMTHLLEINKVFLDDVTLDQEFLQEMMLMKLSLQEESGESDRENLLRQINNLAIQAKQACRADLIEKNYKLAAWQLSKYKFLNRILNDEI